MSQAAKSEISRLPGNPGRRLRDSISGVSDALLLQIAKTGYHLAQHQFFTPLESFHLPAVPENVSIFAMF
jgi:hypothetical protein